ncbi:MAG: hypothetical protein WCO58_02615 [bacterium]
MNSENINPNNHDDILIAQGAVRTFKKDVAQALTGEQGSLVKMTIEKERAEENVRKSTTLASLPNKLFFVFGIIISIATVVILGISLKNYVQKTTTEVLPPIQPLIFFNKQDKVGPLPSDVETLKNTLEKSYIKNTSNAGLTRIAFGNERADGVVLPVTTEQLLSIVDKNIPRKLVIGANGMFEWGMVNGTDVSVPFIILTLSGTDGSFQGMNEWERTMAQNILPLFDYETLPADPLFYKVFDDSIIENQNVRVLRDEFGQDVLLWSIVNTKTVIITTNKEAFRVLLERIHSSTNPLLQ